MINIKSMVLLIECWGGRTINCLVEVNNDNVDVYTEINKNGFCALFLESKEFSDELVNKDSAVHTSLDYDCFNKQINMLNIDKWKKVFMPLDSIVYDGDQWKLFIVDNEDAIHSYFGENCWPAEMNDLLSLLKINYKPSNYK